MRKIILTAVALSLLLYTGSFAASSKPLCIVANFETSGGAAKALSESTAQIFMTALAYMGDYKVLSYKKQAKAMESLGKKKGAAISSDDALELAAVVEADVVVTGEVAKSGKSYEVSMKIIDVTTGKVIKTGSATRKYQSGISKSIDEILGLT
jgi:TolB-like protein